ncbi:hypothetical protein PNQ29_01115 [Halobacterium salinarum]|uniref:hypothetical protein n=1 Tax=Halobacterium salinarum TaxID=2242 RepID=UPI002557B2AE|nr:hypothetical protein [Halobacterium salinarum]MDL0118356.1 hypothetical protein [Halobacterium salinarum]
MVVLDGSVLSRLYPRVSRYNSPYPAHDAGCAVDLYPDGSDGPDGRALAAPSPVAGAVVDTRTVACPQRPYATDTDHLIVVDTGAHLARILHVEPAVSPGDTVAVGESLGSLVRSGFFAPWVTNHIHLGFREHGQNAVRASGSLPVTLDVAVRPAPWDGTATVTAVGDTWARLDAPSHPAPGDGYAGLATDGGGVVDGGLPHYETGYATTDADPVAVLGRAVGDRVSERTVAWRDTVGVTVDDTAVQGLSLWLGRDELGCTVVAPGHDHAVGDRVAVAVDTHAADTE